MIFAMISGWVISVVTALIVGYVIGVAQTKVLKEELEVFHPSEPKPKKQKHIKNKQSKSEKIRLAIEGQKTNFFYD